MYGIQSKYLMNVKVNKTSIAQPIEQFGATETCMLTYTAGMLFIKEETETIKA